MSEEPTCASCKIREKDSKKIIECVNCHKHQHLKCKGGTAVKFRNKKYCSFSCREGEATVPNNTVMEQQIQEVLMEIKKSREETANDIKQLKTEVHTTIQGIEKFQDFLSEKLDSLLGDIKKLWEEHDTLKHNVTQLEAKQQTLQTTVNHLEMEIDRINRASISRHMIVLGVPAKANEEVGKIIQSIGAVLGCDIPSNAIVDAKRLLSRDQKQPSGRSQPIKVVFATDRYKEELLEKKKKKGSLLYSSVDPSYSATNCPRVLLRDELTPYGMQLLNKVRDLQEMINLKFVWPGRNGSILVKKTEISKTVIIRNQQDVDDLERLNNKRNLNSSPAGSSKTGSPDLQPGSKRRQ